MRRECGGSRDESEGNVDRCQFFEKKKKIGRAVSLSRCRLPLAASSLNTRPFKTHTHTRLCHLTMAVPITLVHKLKAWDAGVDPAATTWEDVKCYAANEVGVPESAIRLLFRGRECGGRPEDEPLGFAGIRGGEKIAIAERMRSRPLTSFGEDNAMESEGGDEDDEDESSPSPAPAPAAPTPPPPTTPADRLAAVATSLDALEADAEPLLAASAARRPTWPPDAAKTALRTSELATQALLKLDAIDPPDDAGDDERQAFRATRKALINRAVALGEKMDRVKGQLA